MESWYVPDFFNRLTSTDASRALGELEALDWDSYWQTVDTFEQEANEDPQVEVVVGTAAVVTTAASLTYAIWSIRSASVVASIASSLPAWALIDPLPITDPSALAPRPNSTSNETLPDIAKQGPESHS